MSPTDADPVRLIAADMDEDQPRLRRRAEPASLVQFMLRYDPTHELPHVVESPHGLIIARFRQLGDLSVLVSKDKRTLPASYIALVEGPV